MKPFWPLAVNSWTWQERRAAKDVIESGQLTMGECVREFETVFAKYVGSRYAVMTNSGSSSNLLMVATLVAKWNLENPSLGFNHGLEVIAPAIAWPTTYAPFAQHGFKLRILDIDAYTLNTEPKQLFGSITLSSTSRILVGVSILGNPCWP